MWEGFLLKGNMEERACELATYIIENKSTVRAAAKKFGISKSTVHTVRIFGVDTMVRKRCRKHNVIQRPILAYA